MVASIRLILLLLFFSPLLFGQTAHVVGNIKDLQAKPVSRVSVRLLEFKKGKLSDEQGEFHFHQLAAGIYTLQASYVGFKTLTQKIQVEDGKTLSLSLELLESTTDLKEIVVVGQISQNEKPVSIGKLPIRPMDLPQSMMTLDRSLLETQQVKSMSDVLMNTNGVYIMGATGGYQEEIAARGFPLGSSNTFKNGMRFASGMITEFSGVEKVEILKGSTAILFGNVAAGGVLNLVTKKPKFTWGGEMGLRSGSWSALKPTLDIYGGLSSKVAARLNASVEEANSFREGVSSKRSYVNPSLLFKLNDRTELLLEGDYLNDQRTPDFGAGIINYQIVNVPRERFLGVAWSYMKQEQASVNLNLTHRINPNWTLKIMGGFRQNASDLFANTRPNAGALISEDGTWVRNLQKTDLQEKYGIAQVDLTGNFKLGQMNHQVLLGADADFFNTVTNAYTNYMRYDTVNVYGTRLYQKRSDQPLMPRATTTTAPVNRLGIYVQDLVHISEKMKLLAGLRYSYQQTGSEVYTYSTSKTAETINFDGAFSPRFGLVYQPSPSHSLFASYANSFTINSGVDINNQALPPSLIDQYEIGLKNELFGGLLSANVTAYRILNNNLAQNSLINATTYSYVKELAGSVQSEGVELDLMSKPLFGFSFQAGYSFNETKYVKSNTYIEGSLLKYNPRHTANAGISYRRNGFQAGITTVYIGERFAGRSTRVAVANDAYRLIQLPDYLQADFTAAYRFRNIAIRAKVANIGDVISYNVHDDNSVNPIAPRNWNLGISYIW